VFGFLGLDVLLVYWAFRVNYRSARAYEVVTVTPSELTVRKVSYHGRVRNGRSIRSGSGSTATEHKEFGIERLFLVSHGRRLPIAASWAHARRKASRLRFPARWPRRNAPTRTVFGSE